MTIYIYILTGLQTKCLLELSHGIRSRSRPRFRRSAIATNHQHQDDEECGEDFKKNHFITRQ